MPAPLASLSSPWHPLWQSVPPAVEGNGTRSLAIGSRPWGEQAAVALTVERRSALLGILDRGLVRAAISGFPGSECTGAAARNTAEGRGIQLRSKQLLEKLHPRLVEATALL